MGVLSIRLSKSIFQRPHRFATAAIGWYGTPIQIGNTLIMLSNCIWLRAPINIIRTFAVHLWRQSVAVPARSSLLSVRRKSREGRKPWLAQIMAFSLNFTRKVRKLFAETFAVIAQPPSPRLGDLWPQLTNEVGATETRRGSQNGKWHLKSAGNAYG